MRAHNFTLLSVLSSVLAVLALPEPVTLLDVSQATSEGIDYPVQLNNEDSQETFQVVKAGPPLNTEARTIYQILNEDPKLASFNFLQVCSGDLSDPMCRFSRLVKVINMSDEITDYLNDTAAGSALSVPY